MFLAQCSIIKSNKGYISNEMGFYSLFIFVADIYFSFLFFGDIRKKLNKTNVVLFDFNKTLTKPKTIN